MTTVAASPPVIGGAGADAVVLLTFELVVAAVDPPFSLDCETVLFPQALSAINSPNAPISKLVA